jgi:DHA2 family multidrug resistance protein-like MFS transporter
MLLIFVETVCFNSLQVRSEVVKGSRWFAMSAMMLGVLAVGLDVTVLSVALPTLAGALHASESDLQWFSSGYALALAAGMLPAGVLGDRFGRKRVMLTALALFAAGSLTCAYATGPGLFIAARVVLGLAGSGLVVMTLSVATVLFDEAERPRAIGIWAAANFIALPIGPIFGGWLLTHFWWGWVFLMNVPVAALGAIAVALLVPESRAPRRPALDPVGIGSASLGLAGVTYGLIELGRNGWTDPRSLGVLVAGLAVLVLFFAWERRLTDRPDGRPLIELQLFRIPAFTWGITLTGLGALVMFGLVFTLPQYSQGVVGTDALGAGVRLLPIVGGLVLGAVPADRVARWAGAKLTVAAGFAIISAGLLVGAKTTSASSAQFVAIWMSVAGFGMGLAFATAASAALQKVPADRSGVASALVQALQKVGAPFGSAVLGSVLVNAYQSQLNLSSLPGPAAAAVRQSVFAGVAVASRLHSPALLQSVRHAFVAGMDASLVVSAGVAIAALLLALLFLPGRDAARQRAALAEASVA